MPIRRGRRGDQAARRATVLVGAFAFASCATTPRPPEPRPAPRLLWGAEAADRALGPFLFEVTGPGAPIHLFGTMHSEPLASVPPAVMDRFASAGTVAFEADIEKVDPTRVLGLAMLPPTESLDREIGPEAWQRLQEHLAEMVPPPALARFRPWVAVALVLQKASGLSPGAEVMDMALLKRSRAQGKSVRFLETPEEQFAILERTMDAGMLAALTKELDALPSLYRSLADAYRAGDMAALEAVLDRNELRAGMSEEQMRRLLGARNERWIPFLETMAGEGGGFVAAGALHLPGPDGLVALLRARGHRVRRLLAPGSTPQPPPSR